MRGRSKYIGLAAGSRLPAPAGYVEVFVLFVKPPVEAYRDPSLEDSLYLESHGARTYAEYNYLGGGLTAKVKLGHFEKVLALCRDLLGSAPVIDFGCADGVFLPSLSKYFPHVTGVDIRQDFIKVSRVVCDNLGLDNVTLICNQGMSFDRLREAIPGPACRLAFVLEVLEHVGDRDTMYEDKVALVGDLFGLLDRDGRVVVSVPKMTGIAFLVQRIGLSLFGLKREPVSTGELLRATFLGNTDALEERWVQDHIGFNHRKLETFLGREFRILRRTGTFFQAIYLLSRR